MSGTGITTIETKNMARGKSRRHASKSKSKGLEEMRKAVRSGLHKLKSKSPRKSRRCRRSRSETSIELEILPKSVGRQFKEKVDRQKSARVVEILKMLASKTS